MAAESIPVRTGPFRSLPLGTEPRVKCENMGECEAMVKHRCFSGEMVFRFLCAGSWFVRFDIQVSNHFGCSTFNWSSDEHLFKALTTEYLIPFEQSPVPAG